jgi:hypothetical protein
VEKIGQPTDITIQPFGLEQTGEIELARGKSLTLLRQSLHHAMVAGMDGHPAFVGKEMETRLLEQFAYGGNPMPH